MAVLLQLHLRMPSRPEAVRGGAESERLLLGRPRDERAAARPAPPPDRDVRWRRLHLPRRVHGEHGDRGPAAVGSGSDITGRPGVWIWNRTVGVNATVEGPYGASGCPCSSSPLSLSPASGLLLPSRLASSKPTSVVAYDGARLPARGGRPSGAG